MKTNGIALKAKIQYSTWDDSNWHCYYHALSGDELKKQIISIFYKPTGDERSWSFEDLSAYYKICEEDGLRNWIKQTYGEKVTLEDVEEVLTYICRFFNDACEEFGRKPLVKEHING